MGCGRVAHGVVDERPGQPGVVLRSEQSLDVEVRDAGFGEGRPHRVAQVAARAGFTKGAVYSNFGGKPELFAAAMQAYFAGAVVGAFADALGAAATVTE